MKTQLYGILNARTKRWWHHRHLRGRGQVGEARRRERAQIRDDVVRLRAALEGGGFLVHSWGGWTLHYGGRRRLQSSRPGLDSAIPRACLLLGIPVLDLTTIPDERIREVFKIPNPDLLYDPEPPEGYRSFHHAPFDYVARLYAALGATVYNADIGEEKGQPQVLSRKTAAGRGWVREKPRPVLVRAVQDKCPRRLG